MNNPAPGERVPARYFFSAAAMDGGFFLIMVAVPFKVLAIGGDSLALGLVPAAISITYIIFTQLAGRWSDSHDRNRLCLAGSLILVVATLFTYSATHLGLLLVLALFMGLGKALYWPVIQATIGELSGPGRLIRNTGLLNVSWSGGKALGFFFGGALLALFGFKITFLTGAVVVAAAFFLLPRRIGVATGTPGSESTSGDSGDGSPTTVPADAQRRLYRHMSWLGNIGAYGAFGILNYHLPQLFTNAGWDENRFGIFLATILIVQTTVFIVLIRSVRFAYSISRLWLPQSLIMVALLVTPWLDELGGFAGFMAITPLLGIGLGFCYAASMYYSLHTDRGKGRNAGIHESLIGVGSFLPPLLGGGAARMLGWLDAPYILGAACITILLGVQIVMWNQARERQLSPVGQKGQPR